MAATIDVLTLRAPQIAAVTAFIDSELFAVSGCQPLFPA